MPIFIWHAPAARRSSESLLSPVQGKVGESKLAQLCKDGDLHVGELFKADPAFDPEDTPDADHFLKEQKLSVVPL